ncbi:hypothetical protein CRUP_019155 [Coryphaenoides rupestris]|nr:hypothetical protein CRUP_019155 [Coryphaenoides rupestris]
MDGESGLVIGRSQRERKRTYRDFLLDVDHGEEWDSSDQEFSAGVTHKLLQYDSEDNPLHTVSPAEGTIEEPASPLAEYWVYLNDKHNSFESTLTSHHNCVTHPIAHHTPYPIISMPGSPAANGSPMDYTEGGTSVSGLMAEPSVCGDVSGADLVLVNAAAHLHLLGESLALIGHELHETDKAVCVSSSVSLLMDSLLCALVPLVSLTAAMPEFRDVPQHTLADAMENIAYMMPGL